VGVLVEEGKFAVWIMEKKVRGRFEDIDQAEDRQYYFTARHTGMSLQRENGGGGRSGKALSLSTTAESR
jgi:hypothetical protein